jgi:hypothetical protein
VRQEIRDFNSKLARSDRTICDLLADTIDRELPEAESKIWHRHPVWFLDGNPTVGYSKQKPGIRLMFWSGASFEEPHLDVLGKNFMDASIFYNSIQEIDTNELERWLSKSRDVAWDYKNIIKAGGLVRLR